MAGPADQDAGGRELRVAVVGEGDLGHRVVVDRFVEGLGRCPGVHPTGRLVGDGGRLQARLVRSFPAMRGLDAQPLRWRLALSLRARRALARATPSADVAIVNTQSAALLARRAMRAVPVAVSIDCTGRQFSELGYGDGPRRPGDRPGEQALEALERRAYAGAELVVAWTPWVARSLAVDYGLRGERVLVAHPGIDVARWTAPERPADADGPLRLLFVGGDTRRKGLPELLTALEALPGRVVLDVVSGDERVDDRDPRMTVHRGVAPGSPEMHALYARADAFVLPTHADALSWAVLEALASGLPVVTTAVGGTLDLVDDAAVLVPPRDPARLREALEALAADPARRRAMAARGRDRAAAFDLGVQATRLADGLRAAVDRRSARAGGSTP